MRVARRTILLLLLATGAAFATWQGLIGSGTPVARASSGMCDASMSTLVTDHTLVPAGGNFAATLTATCLDSLGNRISGRTIILQPSTGGSNIVPPSAVTDANGVATFSVSDNNVPPPGQGYPITYTAVDTTSFPDIYFNQSVTLGFYYCSCGGPPLPTEAIGGVGLTVVATGALVFWQVRRRRRFLKQKVER